MPGPSRPSRPHWMPRVRRTPGRRLVGAGRIGYADPMSTHQQAAAQIAEALQHLQDTFRVVEETADPQQAFELATKLVDDLGNLYEQAADLRARQVGRIWRAEELSLADLAERISVSKARAGQFVTRAARLGATMKEGERP